MTGVRRVSRSILKYFVALYVVAVIIQIFLAGEGIFGGTEEPIEDAAILDPHRGLGWFLTAPIALLLLIVALLAWLPNKRLRWISVALPFLLFLQLILAELGRWGGAFHPLNAILVLALLGYLARQLWRPVAEPVTPI
jgi:uncharacterized BrkB/YihY/UPF0761 family membrane protein